MGNCSPAGQAGRNTAGLVGINPVKELNYPGPGPGMNADLTILPNETGYWPVIDSYNVCCEGTGSEWYDEFNPASYCLWISDYNNDGSKKSDYEWWPYEIDKGCRFWSAPSHETYKCWSSTAGEGKLCGDSGSYEIDGLGPQDSRRYSCRRQGWNAFPAMCCFKDWLCNQDNTDSLYNTTNRRRTCAPKYRALGSNACQDEILPYCNGTLLIPNSGITDWKQMWIPNGDIPMENILFYAVSNYSEEQGPDSVKNGTSFFDGQGNFSSAGIKWGSDGYGYVQEPFIPITDPRNSVPMQQPCIQAVLKQTFTLPTENTWNVNSCNLKNLEDKYVSPSSVNEEGVNWSQNLISTVFEKYIGEIGGPQNFFDIDEGGNLESQNQKFKNTMFELCSKFPFLCVNALTKVCSSVTASDLDSIGGNPEAQKWCGCYMEDSQYDSQSVGGLVQKQCTTFCNNNKTIPLINAQTYEKVNCLENLCVINDVTINLYKARGQDMNFSEICPGCGNSEVSFTYEDGYSSIVSLGSPSVSNVLSSQYSGVYQAILFLIDRSDSSISMSENYSNYSNTNPIIQLNIKEGVIVENSIELINTGNESFNKQIPQPPPPPPLPQKPPPFPPVNLNVYYLFFKNSLNPLGEPSFIKLDNPFTIPATTKAYINNNTVNIKPSSENTVKYYANVDGKPRNVTSQVIAQGDQNSSTVLLPYPWPGGFGADFQIPYDITKITKTSNINIQNSKIVSNSQKNLSRCTCRLTGNIDILDSTVTTLNLPQNCGNVECYNNEGQPVSCTGKDTKPVGALSNILSNEKNESLDQKYTKSFSIVISIIVFLFLLLTIFKFVLVRLFK